MTSWFSLSLILFSALLNVCTAPAFILTVSGTNGDRGRNTLSRFCVLSRITWDGVVGLDAELYLSDLSMSRVTRGSDLVMFLGFLIALRLCNLVVLSFLSPTNTSSSDDNSVRFELVDSSLPLNNCLG